MQAPLLTIFFSWLISMLVTFYLVPICCSIANKIGILDVPDGAIKKHERATPYLGGLAVYLGFIIGLAIVCPLESNILFFLLGITLLLFVGLIDDVIVTKPHQKVLGQCLAALCFLKAGLHLKENFFLTNVFNVPLSLFWMLLIINAFNLVDVMDGLATSLASFATIGFLLIALLTKNYPAAYVLSSFLGALMAFLWYNLPRAHIYLGDAGSLFIGGFLSVIPFFFNWSFYQGYGFLTPFIILAIPLLEVSFLIVIRTYKGIPFYQGSPHHFSIYLKTQGWSVISILYYIGFLSLILIVAALLFFFNIMSLPVITLMGALFLFFWIYATFLHKVQQ